MSARFHLYLSGIFDRSRSCARATSDSPTMAADVASEAPRGKMAVNMCEVYNRTIAGCSSYNREPRSQGDHRFGDAARRLRGPGAHWQRILRSPNMEYAAGHTGSRQVISLAVVFDGIETEGLNGGQFALWPDGSTVLVAAKDAGLFARRFDSVSLTPVENTAGADFPVFSPDGRWIAFVQGGQLRKMPADGGVATLITQVRRATQFDWSVDDTIVFAQSTEQGTAIFGVPASGGDSRALVLPSAYNASDLVMPQLLPGKNALLCTRIDRRTGGSRFSVVAIPLPHGDPRVVVEDGAEARFANGVLTYLTTRTQTLTAIGFDPAALQTVGEAKTIVAKSASEGGRGWAIAADTLVYTPQHRGSDTLTWVQRGGAAAPLPSQPDDYSDPRLSPDTTKVAVTVSSGSSSDIWVYDAARDTRTQLTHDGTSSDPGVDARWPVARLRLAPIGDRARDLPPAARRQRRTIGRRFCRRRHYRG